MKVCLIDAAAVSAKRFLPHWTPLGLAYIAAVLEQEGHEVLIIERDVLLRKNLLNIDKVNHIMEEKLTEFGPDLLGLSSATELFPDIVKSARVAKRLFPAIPVVYGGHHASAVVTEALETCKERILTLLPQAKERQPCLSWPMAHVMRRLMAYVLETEKPW